ncbi:hypothetical protein PVAP13_6NG221100 [Panicum virgatum]|uniref:Uncharacterized protein n=1 Tax=Panicum virgatum TaxID=38727 RepID=A0A8T0R014_PANVG|nr:hypothetical protein PVAP13_6NG221100 [Panicum virgatum]
MKVIQHLVKHPNEVSETNWLAGQSMSSAGLDDSYQERTIADFKMLHCLLRNLSSSFGLYVKCPTIE